MHFLLLKLPMLSKNQLQPSNSLTHPSVVTWVLKNNIMLRNVLFLLFLFAGLPWNSVLVHCTRASFWPRGWIGTGSQTSICWISYVLWFGTVAAQRKGCLFFIQPKCPLGWWWLCLIPSKTSLYNWLFRVSDRGSMGTLMCTQRHADVHDWDRFRHLVRSTCHLGFLPQHTLCPRSVRSLPPTDFYSILKCRHPPSYVLLSGSDIDWLQAKEGADQSMICSLSLDSSLFPRELVIGWRRNVHETGRWNQRKAEPWQEYQSWISIRLVSFFFSKNGFVSQMMQTWFSCW